MNEIHKNVEKILRNESTNFISPYNYKKIISKLNKNDYKVFYPYKDAEKIILYTNVIPKIRLYEIKTNEKLRHQSILGSLYGFSIAEEMFGDIIIQDDKFYVYIIDEISNYVQNNLTMIGNVPVKLEERNIELLEKYERIYEEEEIIVSSLRIDTVISKIIKLNRDKIKNKIKTKEVIVNYEALKNTSYTLKENDIFSIKRYGKYKFIGKIKNTKKNNYIIKYYKYI